MYVDLGRRRRDFDGDLADTAPSYLFSQRGALNALWLTLILAVFGAWRIGQAQQVPQVLHSHVRPAVSSGQAALVGQLPADRSLQIAVVLPIRNRDQLTALLGRLYDPRAIA